MLDEAACYRALLAKDPRFDGLFFVGVSTTGIYCRSVCPAKKPRSNNCSFYPSAAAAEEAGYRPCRRCRPERAPAAPAYRARAGLAAGIVSRIQAGSLDDGRSIGDLASSFGVSERQLRRIVKGATGVTPSALAQNTRLLLANQLLKETDLSITRVALDSGFGSLRRFNELFVEAYGLCPRDFRRRRRGRRPAELELRLGYRPPLAWRQLLGFLSARAIPGVERVRDGRYERTVAIGEAAGRIRIRLAADRSEVWVRVSSSLSPHLQSILSRVRHLLDLSATPDLIDAVLCRDPHLAAVVEAVPGRRVPGAFDGFELAWRAILGQQISVAAATTLAGRLVQRFGTPAPAPAGELAVHTPTSAALAEASTGDIASLGLILARARAIQEIARLDLAYPDLLCPGSPPEFARARLSEVSGVGPWTIEYILMRALHWPDSLPGTDLGLRQAASRIGLRDLESASEGWRPWRSYAAMHLWGLLPA